jgi:2'-5' RNA ligase
MRLFFAVPVIGRAALELEQRRRLLSTPRGGHWLEMRDWHVTLAFLGDTDGALLPALCELGERVAEAAAQTSLHLHTLEWWPSASKPRLLAAVGEPPQALLALRRELLAGLRELGVDYDGKPLRPHITLLRMERAASATDTAPVPCAIDLEVTQLALYRSERERGATRYRPLWQVELPGLFY